MKKLFLIVAISLTFITNPSLAWSGYDYENEKSIEIEAGNLIREGLIFEYRDVESGDYYSAKVQQLNYLGQGAELIITDLETEEQKTFIME